MRRNARLIALCVSLTAASLVPACARAPVASAPVALRVPGRINQTPNLAVSGDTVAVSWAAVDAEAAADVYVAMSRDAAATFSEAIRVNDVPGEARSAEQQAPRIAMHGDTVAVLWTSRRGAATEIRLAVSQDGGRSFGPSRRVSAEGVPGTRGWGSLLVEEQGRVQALWLDTRVAAIAAAAARDGGSPTPHVHGSGPMPSTRQDVYAAAIDADGTVHERLVTTAVCFCCKTAIVRTGTDFWGAWRDVYGDNIRDISFARLTGPGELSRVRVSQDGWQIAGCPEDGPAMAVAPGSVFTGIVWPTVVPGPSPAKGIFFAETADGQSFAPRVRVDNDKGTASHPGMAITSTGLVGVTWDVVEAKGRRIELRVRRHGTWDPIETITSGQPDMSPTIGVVGDDFLVAWGRGTPNASTIELRRVVRD